MKEKKESRLLERAFKLRFGLKLCVLTIIGVFTFTAVIYTTTARSVGGSYVEAIYTIYDLKIRIFPLIFASFYSIFILGLITLAIAAISVFFSHRIAGPIFRIERNIEALGAGDLTVSTKLRGSDQLSALADELNSTVRALNHMARSLGDALAEVEASEERLRELAARSEVTDAQRVEALEGAASAARKLKTVVTAVKTR